MTMYEKAVGIVGENQVVAFVFKLMELDICIDRGKARFDELPTIPWWLLPVLWFVKPVIRESKEYEDGKIVTYKLHMKVFFNIIYAVKEEKLQC